MCEHWPNSHFKELFQYNSSHYEDLELSKTLEKDQMDFPGVRTIETQL